MAHRMARDRQRDIQSCVHSALLVPCLCGCMHVYNDRRLIAWSPIRALGCWAKMTNKIRGPVNDSPWGGYSEQFRQRAENRKQQFPRVPTIVYTGAAGPKSSSVSTFLFTANQTVAKCGTNSVSDNQYSLVYPFSFPQFGSSFSISCSVTRRHAFVWCREHFAPFCRVVTVGENEHNNKNLYHRYTTGIVLCIRIYVFPDQGSFQLPN